MPDGDAEAIARRGRIAVPHDPQVVLSPRSRSPHPASGRRSAVPRRASAITLALSQTDR
jgi:hypothetical protein